MVAVKTKVFPDASYRLKQLARHARRNNYRTRGLMSSPPTVSASGAQPAGMTKAYRWIDPATKSVFRFYGGAEKTQSGAYRWFPVAKVTNTGTAGNMGDGRQAINWRVKMMVDAIAPAFRLYGSPSAPYRFIVDGQYVDTTGVIAAAAPNNFVQLTFSTRAVREIIVEGEFAAGFDGVHVGVTESVFAPKDEKFRLIVVGDSFTAALGATRASDGWARVMGDYLGVDDLWCSGVGSTGYINNNTTLTNFNDRVADVTDNSPDFVVVQGSVNDKTYTQAQVQTAALSFYSAIRAALPSVPMFIIGPTVGGGIIPSQVAAADAGLRVALATMADPLMTYISFSHDPVEAWFTGTGKISATNGTGNSDLYIWTDGAHPSDAGHAFMGQRAADAVIAALPVF